MKSKIQKLWVITPVYYDYESFMELKRQVEVAMRFLEGSVPIQFIVIDDSAGADCDIQKLAILPNVHVVKPPFNLGHQRTIVFGIRSILHDISDHDLVVTMDSDGEDRPQDLPQIYKTLKDNENYYGVVARRTKRHESVVFKTMYFCYKIFFYALTGITIKNGNYALFRGNHLKNIINHPYFDLCYSSTILALKIPIGEVPCERGRRYFGESKMNMSSLITHGIRMLMPFLDKIAIRSLIIFSVSFFLGIVGIVAVVSIKIFTDNAIPGWASFLTAIIVCFSFISLGNFLILFATFTQNQGLALNFLDGEKVEKDTQKRTSTNA